MKILYPFEVTRKSRSLALILCVFASFAVGRPSAGQDVANNLPEATDAQNQGSPAQSQTNTVGNADNAWHIRSTLYLWFPGVHGVMGAFGHDVSYRASAGDLLSNARFGAMATVVAERGRYVMLTDLIWVRLGADRQQALPFPGVPELSAEVKAYELIASPEFGFRAVDGKRFKLDALAGLRYWHVGSSIEFTPSLPGLNSSTSKNWADPLMGARIQFPLSEKALITVLGDAGVWGAADLDYQIVGVLSYKLKPKLTLVTGYRYLYVNYRPDNFVYQAAMSGPFLGATYHFK